MLILYACSFKLVEPTQSDVERVSGKFPGYTLTALSEGKASFQKQCTTCHKLKNPASKTEEEWKVIIPKMVQNANKKSERIDAKTQESILRYLTTMGKTHKNR